MRPSRALAGIWLLAGAAWAQTSDEGEEPVYVYEIEAIVVRNLQTTPPDPTLSPAGYVESTLDLWPDVETPAEFGDPLSEPESEPVEDDEPRFVPLDSDELALTDMADKIAASDDYEVLLHRGWRQPEVAFGDPQPIRLHGTTQIALEDAAEESVMGDPRNVMTARDGPAFGDSHDEMWVDEDQEPTYELDGWITFTMGRFNHINVNMELRKAVVVVDESEPSEVVAPLEPPLESVQPRWFEDFTDEQTRAAAWQLVDRRRTRFDELQYFDSEPFGIIARATRLEVAQPDEREDTENELDTRPAGSGG